MSFFFGVKGCVNFYETTSLHEKCVLALNQFVTGAFSENDRIAFKFDSFCFLVGK